MLLGFVVLIVGITLYQERKTERAIEALRDLASPRALVVRDGRKQRVPGATSCAKTSSSSARATACRPTASSSPRPLRHRRVAAHRRIGRRRQDRMGRHERAGRPGGEELPFVYAGTLVVEGAATAQVTATGERTEMGKIGRALGSAVAEDTRCNAKRGGWSGSSRSSPARSRWPSS